MKPLLKLDHPLLSRTFLWWGTPAANARSRVGFIIQTVKSWMTQKVRRTSMVSHNKACLFWGQSFFFIYLVVSAVYPALEKEKVCMSACMRETPQDQVLLSSLIGSRLCLTCSGGRRRIPALNPMNYVTQLFPVSSVRLLPGRLKGPRTCESLGTGQELVSNNKDLHVFKQEETATCFDMSRADLGTGTFMGGACMSHPIRHIALRGLAIKSAHQYKDEVSNHKGSEVGAVADRRASSLSHITLNLLPQNQKQWTLCHRPAFCSQEVCCSLGCPPQEKETCWKDSTRYRAWKNGTLPVGFG